VADFFDHSGLFGSSPRIVTSDQDRSDIGPLCAGRARPARSEGRDSGGVKMMDRARGVMDHGKAPRRARRPVVESLEGRQMLDASLPPIGPVTVPATLGLQVPLNGSASGAASQTYTVQTSNPDIKATVTQGKFLTLTISHTAADAN